VLREYTADISATETLGGFHNESQFYRILAVITINLKAGIVANC